MDEPVGTVENDNRASQMAWHGMLSLSRLTLVLEPERPWRPGPELANTIRGAFGLAVRETACVVPGADCEGCREGAHCLLPVWFEGQGPQRPFALRVLWPAGELVSRHRPVTVVLTFFGKVPRASLVMEAIQRMARKGLGHLRVPHRIVHATVEGDGAPVTLSSGATSPIWPEPAPLSRLVCPPDEPRAATVHLVTRLSFGHQPPPWRPEPADVIHRAILRVRAVASAQGVRLPRRWPDPREVGGSWLELHWNNPSRWSPRQEQTVNLGGWVGSMRLEAELVAPFIDLLAAAEVLQVGKKTSFGMGVVAVCWD